MKARLVATRKPKGGRSGAGSSNFTTSRGDTISGARVGEIGETIAETLTRDIITRHFGGRYTRLSHSTFAPNAKTTLYAPWDARCGRHAFDIKTISATSTYQKVAIKTAEARRKIRAARKSNWTSNIIIQRVDVSARTITVYLLKGDTRTGYIPSKNWYSKDALKLGAIKFNPARVLG